jgi:N-acetylglucosamine kinase-like BadF-type ATPase
VSTPVLLGVDGGGTHTRVRVANAAGQTLASAETGSSNVSINGLKHAQREIASAIRHALARSQRRRDDIAALCLGISGVDTSRERELFSQWARDSFTPRVEVVNDAELVLAAGTPDAWGIAVIGGTGSIGFGRTRAGSSARTGGWGYLIGDEGAGGELGRAALRAAVQAADGRGPATRLLDAILEFWDLPHPSDILGRVYRAHPDGGALRPADLAVLAPLVLAAADDGDPVARNLVMQTAHALAAHVTALARQLPFGPVSIPLALGGGLLVGSARIQRELVHKAAAEGCEFGPIGLAPEPVAGAVILAQRLLDR